MPTIKQLSDTRALIVGGTAGIGFACAKHLLDAGIPQIIVAGRNAERGEKAAESLGDRANYIQCDASDAAQTASLAEQANAHMGSIDLLLSCGGGDPMPSLLHKIAPGDLIPTINGIQAPILHPAHAVLPYMTEQGGGIVRGTPLYDKLMDHDFASKLFGKAEKMAALGIVTPEDIAEMVVFLASPASAKTTGQTISITGGISAI